VSLVKQDARPLAKALSVDLELGDTAQWAHFLRNHDELDLGRLSNADRKRVFAALGPDPSMQLYDRGLRRRLAPMLDGSREKLELLHSLCMALPGTPVLWYGDELGMGEDLELDQRTAVRTPMQWSSGPQAGFSTVEHLVRPIVSGRFGPQRVNVADQRRDPSSLLNWMERLIRLRKETPEIGWGKARVLKTGDAAVLALRYDLERSAVVTLHNFAAAARNVTLSAKDVPDRLVDLMGKRHASPRRGGGHKLRLEPHGYRWFRLGSDDADAAPADD
jgi:maltose alpha-D-glucosyltransferase/alpha-amylase